jgi:hypothetical protein
MTTTKADIDRYISKMKEQLTPRPIQPVEQYYTSGVDMSPFDGEVIIVVANGSLVYYRVVIDNEGSAVYLQEPFSDTPYLVTFPFTFYTTNLNTYKQLSERKTYTPNNVTSMIFLDGQVILVEVPEAPPVYYRVIVSSGQGQLLLQDVTNNGIQDFTGGSFNYYETGILFPGPLSEIKSYTPKNVTSMISLDGQVIFVPERPLDYYRIVIKYDPKQPPRLCLQNVSSRSIIDVTDRSFNYYVTDVKVEDYYYGTLLTEDMDTIIEGMKTVTSAEMVIPTELTRESNLYNHVKTRFLDTVFKWIYDKLPTQGRGSYPLARGIALTIRNFMETKYDDWYYENPTHVFTTLADFKIFPSGTTLGQLVEKYKGAIESKIPTNVLQDLNEEYKQYVNDVVKFYQETESVVGEAVELATRLIAKGNAQGLRNEYESSPNVFRDFLNLHTPPRQPLSMAALDISKPRRVRITKRKSPGVTRRKTYGRRRPSIISRAIRQRNMSLRDNKLNWENKLAMVLEPRHDFVAGRYSDVDNIDIPETIERLTNDYIGAHSGKSLSINTKGGDFERRNYLEYSAEFDSTRHLQVFGYDAKNITDEKKGGDFYQSVKSIVEQFILNKPVVRDAKGSLFLKKIFKMDKESKTAEIAIDGASGTGMEINQDGIILVNYKDNIFKIPNIEPSKYNVDFMNQDKVIPSINNLAKLNFGIQNKKGERTGGWSVHQKYNKGDKIYVLDERRRKNQQLYDRITVANLAKTMDLISKDSSLTPNKRDIAYWACLNLKRAGDQGQALYAKEIGGVFDTLDFLAAAYASLQGVDYLVNSDALKSLYMKITTEISYEDFKTTFINWAVRLGTKSGSDVVASWVPNLIGWTDGNRVMKENSKMDFLSMMKELIGVAITIKGTVDGKQGEIKNNFDKFFGFIREVSTKLSNAASRQSSTISTLKNKANLYASYLASKKSMITFFETTFKFISRLNAALILLIKNIGRFSVDLGIDIREVLISVVTPLLRLLDEIFPNIIQFTTTTQSNTIEQFLTDFLTSIQNTEIEGFLDDLIEKKRLTEQFRDKYVMEIGEFFDFINNIRTLSGKFSIQVQDLSASSSSGSP